MTTKPLNKKNHGDKLISTFIEVLPRSESTYSFLRSITVNLSIVYLFPFTDLILATHGKQEKTDQCRFVSDKPDKRSFKARSYRAKAKISLKFVTYSFIFFAFAPLSLCVNRPLDWSKRQTIDTV